MAKTRLTDSARASSRMPGHRLRSLLNGERLGSAARAGTRVTGSWSLDRDRAAKRLVVLDSLFDSLDLERTIASGHGWQIVPWDHDSEALATADAALHVNTRVDVELLEKMPRCRVIGRFGTGLDTVDQEAARRAGVVVVNVR